MIQTLSIVMQLFIGSYSSVAAASRHFWPNSAIADDTPHVFFLIYKFCFTFFKQEYKTSYIFQSYSNQNNNWYIDMHLNSEVCGL